MSVIRLTVVVRNLMWRIGRKMYTYARGDRENDPRVNGEYWLLAQVLKAPTSAQVLFDVGANKGNWTATALGLSRTLSKIHIHAFEPSLATRSMIGARFVESPSVTVHPYALSDTDGEATFYSNEDGGETNSLSPASGQDTEVVKVTTIDRFMQRYAIEMVSMIKIDTEGADLLVLRGAEESLRFGRISIVQLEYNWRWLLNHGSLRDVFDFIANKPYRFGKLVGDTIEFYDEWHFELDRYFEGNYLLVRRDSELCSLGTDMCFDHSNTISTASSVVSLRQTERLRLPWSFRRQADCWRYAQTSTRWASRSGDSSWPVSWVSGSLDSAVPPSAGLAQRSRR